MQSGNTEGTTVAQNAQEGGAKQLAPLSVKDVYRYRKLIGINLGENLQIVCFGGNKIYRLLSYIQGSWFALEQCLSDEPFNLAGLGSDAAELQLANLAEAKGINLEDHWNTWITEADFKWISERGFNTVRIPVSRALTGEFELAVSKRLFASLDWIFPSLWC